MLEAGSFHRGEQLDAGRQNEGVTAKPSAGSIGLETDHFEVLSYKIPLFFAKQRKVDTAPAIIQVASPEERARMALDLARANAERLIMLDSDTSIH